MKKVMILFLGLALFGCSNANHSAMDLASGSSLITESFTAAPQPPWEWIRENPATHRTGPEGLSIQLEPGGLMGEGKDARNILVRPLPPGAKTISVRVDAQFQSQFEQAGLIVYTDDDTYIKFVLEMVDGKLYGVMVPEEAAQVLGIFKQSIEATPVELVLTLEDGKFTALVGTEGLRQQVGEWLYPMDPRPCIGVFTQSGDPNAPRWATFSNFTIK